MALFDRVKAEFFGIEPPCPIQVLRWKTGSHLRFPEHQSLLLRSIWLGPSFLVKPKFVIAVLIIRFMPKDLERIEKPGWTRPCVDGLRL
ncbi:hypothetical protein [Bradyrhizobium sp. Gha]|uniref:hypothetical protein n=1 Tax=Bradyrhizobium sp. Gha TaxID=1855318 RepID=UPI0015A60047|nr:hypothetical protein [Bradyrhizobium sp. Gha]